MKVFLYPIDQIWIFVFPALSPTVESRQIASEHCWLLLLLGAVLEAICDDDDEDVRL